MRRGTNGASETSARNGGGFGRAVGVLGLLAGVGTTAPRALAVEVTPDPRGSKRPVSVEWGECDPLGEIGSILRVELASRLVDGSPPGDGYRATVTCSGGTVAISVGVLGGTPESFQTDLAGAPANVRPRIVALAIAELVRDLDRIPPPVLPAPLPPPSPTESREEDHLSPEPPASRAPKRAVFGAFAQTSSFELNGAWLAGGGLRFDYVFGGWSAGIDGALLTLTERFEPGTAQVLLGYGSPHAAWEETWGRARARLGAGYALGAAALSGRPTTSGAFAGTTTGPWTAPYAFAALALAISEHVSVDARGGLGWVTSPVVGQVSGGENVELKGLWVSVQAGLAIAL